MSDRDRDRESLMGKILRIVINFSIKIEEEICCILLLCCGGHNERKAKAALSAKIQRDLNSHTVAVPPSVADAVAGYMIDHFDLAPKDSLKILREVYTTMGRAYPYYEE